tara:strand:- start:4671 stop:5918 length:1248 start_codon:yes stop_codon:yes gene_type:complete
MGDWMPSLVVDSSTGTTNITDAALALYGGAGFFEGWWVVFPDGPTGAGSYELRRVSASTTTTLTITPAASNTIGTVSYELHRYDPTQKHYALNFAVQEAFPSLHKPVVEHIVVDGLGENMDFEAFASSAFTDWDDVGTVTEAQETSRVMLGTQSMKLTAGGATAGKSQTLTVNLLQIVGSVIRFRVHVWSSTADSAYAALYFGSGHASNTSIDDGDSTHVGDEDWQWLEITATIPADASEITIRDLLVSSGEISYSDAAECFIDGVLVYSYTIPTSLALDPRHVEMQAIDNRPDGPYVPLGLQVRPISGRRIMLQGPGVISTVAAETDTFELSSPHLPLLYAYALRWLSRTLQVSGVNNEDRQRMHEDKVEWVNTAFDLERRPGVAMSLGRAAKGHGIWKVVNRGETKLLELNGR